MFSSWFEVFGICLWEFLYVRGPLLRNVIFMFF